MSFAKQSAHGACKEQSQMILLFFIWSNNDSETLTEPTGIKLVGQGKEKH